jgi:PAS domain S-box-containing protein
VDDRTQAVLFNAVPLLVLALLYLAATLALVPSLIRERRNLHDVDIVVGAIFPCIAIAAFGLCLTVLSESQPIGDRPVVAFAATCIAGVPAVVFLASRQDRALRLTGARRAALAETRSTERERELAAVSQLSRDLVRANSVEAVARALVEEVGPVLGVDLVALVLIESPGTGRVVDARSDGKPVDWLVGEQFDLSGAPSGVATAISTGESLAIVDAQSSSRVSTRLVERTGMRSAAFVPLLVGGRPLGAIVAGSLTPRVFTVEELDLMQSLSSESALALERLRSAAALGAALERERLLGRIAYDLRAELDLDAVLDVLVREVGEELGLTRCFVRLGEPVAAEWRVPGLPSIVGMPTALPISGRAFAEGHTVTYEDVAVAEDIDEVGRTLLVQLGTRSGLGTPIVVEGETIGVLGLHRGETGPWPSETVALAEAVAREAGLAINTAKLLAENRRRLAEQTSLLEASQALASELHFDAVIRRIVDEVARLLGADAADCWIREADGRLRCRAVLGLPEAEVGRAIPPEGTLAQAIEQNAPVLKRRFAETEQPPPSEHYAVFAEVMDAPISTGGQVRGVLGVCSLEHDRFSENDLTLLHAFARLAVIALRNAEAFEESTRQARVQRGFYRIASVLGEPLSAVATLDAVAQAAAEALGASGAAVLRQVGSHLELAGGYELRDELRALLERGSNPRAFSLAAEERRTLAAPRLAEDERFVDWRAEIAASGAQSLLALPLDEVRGQRGGLVVMLFAEQRRFTDDDLELATHVARAARGALDRSETYELERRARRLAQQLANTGREIATELDPGTVLDELARQATELLETEGASVSLLEGGELVLHSAAGPGSTEVLGARAPSTTRVAGDVIQSREPAVVRDVQADPRQLDADPLIGAGYGGYAAVPLIGPDGNVHGVLAVLSVSPREWRNDEIEALQALAANAAAALSNAELYQRVALEKSQSEAILSNVADGIVAVDREGKVVLWNAAAERITGVVAAEALGRTPEQALGRALAADGDAGVPGRLVALRHGADEVWLSVTETVMRDPSGAISGRIFAFRDISEERRVEEMKSDFVGTVSHELRTPLTSIYGFAETLLREDVHFAEEERRTFLRYIASESERLTTIVDTLLSVARLEAGEIPVRLGPTDVSTLVAEVIETVEAARGDAHNFIADVPAEPLDAEADREKLRHVLGILLDNAVRYSPAGGRVHVSARGSNGRIELRVEDEGIGIAPAEREHIFRKFYRGESSARVVGTGNTGLGLFIAEGLVTAMGGTIRVESEEGEGSTFVLDLPGARTEAPAARV